MEREETEEKEAVRKTEKERYEMKYKVGDKVKVRADLVQEEVYGCETAVDDMVDMRGMTVTIGDVDESGYGIKEDPEGYTWTDEMFEPVDDELTAEEAIRIQGGMCRDFSCCECPIYELIEDEGRCDNLRAEKPDKVIEVLKQWKKDHEKKEVETEFTWCVLIIEADTHTLKHEEKVETDIISMDVQKAEILKKYCSEHDGKYYAISEHRCVVKE